MSATRRKCPRCAAPLPDDPGGERAVCPRCAAVIQLRPAAIDPVRLGRLAGIVLAVLLLGLIGYRIIRGSGLLSERTPADHLSALGTPYLVALLIGAALLILAVLARLIATRIRRR